HVDVGVLAGHHESVVDDDRSGRRQRFLGELYFTLLLPGSGIECEQFALGGGEEDGAVLGYRCALDGAGVVAPQLLTAMQVVGVGTLGRGAAEKHGAAGDDRRTGAVVLRPLTDADILLPEHLAGLGVHGDGHVLRSRLPRARVRYSAVGGGDHDAVSHRRWYVIESGPEVLERRAPGEVSGGGVVGEEGVRLRCTATEVEHRAGDSRCRHAHGVADLGHTTFLTGLRVQLVQVPVT